MLHSKIAWGLWVCLTIVLHIFYESYFVFFLLIASIIVPMIFIIGVYIVKDKIQFAFGDTSLTAKNTKEICTLTIENTSVFPLFKGKCYIKMMNYFTGEEIQDEFFFSINGKGKEFIELECNSYYCGSIHFKIVKVEYYDYFGMFSTAKYPNTSTKLLVLPETFAVSVDMGNIGVDDLESISYSTFKSGYDTSETFEMREYEPGDSMRNIHWKLSSKFDDIYVKEPSLPIQNAVLLLLDTSIPEQAENSLPAVADAMMEALISISQAMANIQLNHSIAWYDYEQKIITSFEIPNVEELSGLMSGILGIKRQRDDVSGLYWYFLLEKNIPFEHIIYITSRNVEDELSHIDNKYKITVLQCIGKEIKEASEDLGIVFSPDNVETVLAQLII